MALFVSPTYPLNAISLEFLELDEVGGELRNSDYEVNALVGAKTLQDAHAVIIGEKRKAGKVVRKIAHGLEKFHYSFCLVDLEVDEDSEREQREKRSRAVKKRLRVDGEGRSRV